MASGSDVLDGEDSLSIAARQVTSRSGPGTTACDVTSRSRAVSGVEDLSEIATRTCQPGADSPKGRRVRRPRLRRLHAFRTSIRSSRPRRANHQTRAISSARPPPIPAIHGNDQELASGV